MSPSIWRRSSNARDAGALDVVLLAETISARPGGVRVELLPAGRASRLEELLLVETTTIAGATRPPSRLARRDPHHRVGGRGVGEARHAA
jgi:hypothetical protein